MAALAEQLKLLAEQQRAAPMPTPSVEPKPLEITGKVFIGSPDKPAANASLTLIDLKDASRIRSFRADKEGNFNSGPLGGGDYALLTDTSEKLPEGGSPWSVQSAPIAAYPGVVIPPQQIDIEHRFGRLTLETTHPLPHLRVEGRYMIESRLLVRVSCPQDRQEKWTRNIRQPKAWPIYVANHSWGKTAPERGGFTRQNGPNDAERNFYALLSQEDLAAELQGTIFRDTAGRFGPGEVAITAAIITDVLPTDYQRPSIDALIKSVSRSTRRGGSEPPVNRDIRFLNASSVWNNTRMELRKAQNSGPDRDNTIPTGSAYEQYSQSQTGYDGDDEFYWLTKGLGDIWLDHLRGLNVSEITPYPHVVSPTWLNLDRNAGVPIEAGKQTRLQIDVPADLQATIQELVEANDGQRFSQVTLGGDHPDPRSQKVMPPRTPESRPDSPLFRSAKITVVGTEPLQNSDGSDQ
jgi:hypothetical protein